jgi:anti-sigma factor RsiW
MQCDQNPISLASYFDGELPPDQVAVLNEHVMNCARCAAEVALLANLRRSLRPARQHFKPSTEFRRKIQMQIAPPPRKRWAWWPASVAAAIAAMLLIVLVWTADSRRSGAVSEIADLHINALASTNPVDVVSTDRHTVKPWFQGRIPFSFNLPEFAGTDYTLLGGRLIYFHQQPGAQLIVAMRQHKISVLIFQESPAFDLAFSGPATTRRNSFSMESWQSQGLRFVIVGDADPAILDNLAQSLKQANR